MTTLKQIAQDPHKALRDLEIRLGAKPGDLIRDMERLAPPGEEWSKHLSYRLASSYYDDEQAQSLYQSHVDQCDYCKTLLETLHPTALDAAEFAVEAQRMHGTAGHHWTVQAAPFALAASLVMAVFVGGSLWRSQSLESQVRQLQASINAGTHALAAAADSIPTVAASVAESWVGDFKIGSGSDAAIAVANATSEPTFSAGSPVHLVTEIQNAPSHTPISVVWVGPDNREVRKEINWTRAGEKHWHSRYPLPTRGRAANIEQNYGSRTRKSSRHSSALRRLSKNREHR